METVLNYFLIPLLVGGLFGCGWLAVNRPRVFEAIADRAGAIFAIVGLVIAVWITALDVAERLISAAFPGRIAVIQQALAPARISPVFMALFFLTGIAVVFLAYVTQPASKSRKKTEPED